MFGINLGQDSLADGVVGQTEALRVAIHHYFLLFEVVVDPPPTWTRNFIDSSVVVERIEKERRLPKLRFEYLSRCALHVDKLLEVVSMVA